MPQAQSPQGPYTIAIAPDWMSVSLTVTRLEDQQPPSVAGATEFLHAAGIVFGIDIAALDSAVAQADGQAVVVARGTAAQHGADARLESLVRVNRDRHPHVDESGHTDFHDLGKIPSVTAGEPVMRRHPAGEGTPGRDVRGQIVAARSGKDVKFAVRLQGVEPSAQDPNVLIATTDGQPVLQRDGISVEPIIRLETVELSVGNIDFVGSVEIHGDVHSGMKIRAAGDVIVGGNMEAAEIECQGNVTVRGGILGHSAQTSRVASALGPAAIVRAAGNVVTRYVENAIVKAGQSVTVHETIIQSEITAIEEVVVGSQDRRKGQILGGVVRATHRIAAQALGGPGSSATKVLVGVNPLLTAALERQRARLNAKLTEHANLSKVIRLLAERRNNPEMLAKARLTLKKTEEEIAEASQEEKLLQDELKLADHARVDVYRSVLAGTTIVIGRTSHFVPEDRGGGSYSIVNGEIAIGVADPAKSAQAETTPGDVAHGGAQSLAA